VRRFAVIGAGPAGIYAADILTKAVETATVDIFDRLPTPYGLIRYGVAPDHPRPAQVKFTPQELRELDESPNVEVIVHPEGMEFDDASLATIRSRRSVKMCVDILQNWVAREPRDRPRRLHLRFLQAPVRILGTDRVTGLRTETQHLTGDGRVRGTGTYTDWNVQAVYRAVGYLSRPVADLPFDPTTGTVPHDAGRVLDLDGNRIPGRYVTGWIKRGPVGLIGHTKKDANETIASLLADLPALPLAAHRDPAGVLAHLNRRNLECTTWSGWQRLDRHEIDLGQAHGRKRGSVHAIPHPGRRVRFWLSGRDGRACLRRWTLVPSPGLAAPPPWPP
jgi:ferredoxin/flavodoxin---NADP+ reductase